MKLKHPSGGKHIDVAPEHVGAYETQGWVKVPATPAKKASAARKRAAAAPTATPDSEPTP